MGNARGQRPSLPQLLILIAILAILLSWLSSTLKALRGSEEPVAWTAFGASAAVVWILTKRRYSTIQTLDMVAASVATTAVPLLLFRAEVPNLLLKYTATLSALTGLWVLGLRQGRVGGG